MACFPSHPTRSSDQMCQDCSYRESGFPFIPNFRETRINKLISHDGKGEAENLVEGANVSVDGGSLICRYMGNGPNLVCG
jgi:hypothetical protein